ncbi:uncharacterized protein LOC133191298 [Saccostrea echinata]|uniref:uncharacterized protein LOC133191298 n=1 Tax=Saccostrea echinata TaxID=191078 RepID=UPI002A8150CB|nr:uncharacterized protein LOC133191298 [Saccostrea echinata]
MKLKRLEDDRRVSTNSTNSSSYASCKTYKKDSAKSNASSHTYLDIDQCIHRIELERCNSIATEASFSDGAHRRTEDTDVQGIRKESANTVPIIQYQMELPKKTGRHAKKYMVIFCMILVCAILSAAIASVFSTKSLRNSLPSDVEEQLSSGNFLPQALFNVSNERVMARIDGLQTKVQRFANDTKITNQNHFESFPNKKDMEDFSNKTKMSIDLLLQTLPNKTGCKTDCRNERNGDYQSCYTFFHICLGQCSDL